MATNQTTDHRAQRNKLITELDELEDRRAATETQLAALLEVLMAQEGEIADKRAELESVLTVLQPTSAAADSLRAMKPSTAMAASTAAAMVTAMIWASDNGMDLENAVNDEAVPEEDLNEALVTDGEKASPIEASNPGHFFTVAGDSPNPMEVVHESYPTVIFTKVSEGTGQWKSYFCSLCGANANYNKGTPDFIRGIRGFNNHTLCCRGYKGNDATLAFELMRKDHVASNALARLQKGERAYGMDMVFVLPGDFMPRTSDVEVQDGPERRPGTGKLMRRNARQ